MDQIVRQVISFEDFTLDTLRRSLSAAGRPVELRPKSFDVLCVLVANAGRLVTKDEIIAAVWPNVTVTDESLARCVSDIRLALDDRSQRLIKTLPRRGYMFSAHTEQRRETRAQLSVGIGTESSDQLRPRLDALWSVISRSWAARRTPIVVALGAAVILAVIGGLLPGPKTASIVVRERPSLAVIPFANMSSDPQQDYFSDGIAEDLRASLSRFSDIDVIAYNSTFRYKGSSLDLPRVGRELDARYQLYGSVRRNGTSLRVAAQLVVSASGKQLWAESYDRSTADIFAVQDELTKEIALKLLSHLNASEAERSLGKTSGSLEAYDYVLRGDALLRGVEGGNRSKNLQAARSLFEKALEIDPRSGRAKQGLALALMQSWTHPGSTDHQQTHVIDRALLLARQAVEAEPASATSHATLGWLLRWKERDVEAAMAYERALALNPNFVDARYGLILAHLGRHTEAIEYLRRIVRLDPFHPPSNSYWLGKAHFFLGDYERALSLIRPASERMTDHRPSRVLLTAVAAHLGEQKLMRSAAAEVLRVHPQFTIGSWLKWLRLARQEDNDRLARGLRMAGLPE